MKAQLDPRSDWVVCTSAPENPVMLLVLKPEVIKARRLSVDDQERLLMECADEVSRVARAGTEQTREGTGPLMLTTRGAGTSEWRPGCKVQE